MATFPILDNFAKNWWVLLIRGIFAFLFGIMALTKSGLTLTALVLLYGVYALADGLMALWVGRSTRAWWLFFGGILGIIAGICTFIYSGITTVALLSLIATWAIVRGLFEVVTAIQLRMLINNEWGLILGGIISIIFGVMLFSNLAAGALAMVWAIGAYALFFGLMMIVLAIRLHGLPGRMEKLA